MAQSSKTKRAVKSWRDFLKTHPAADLFPIMPPDELKAPGQDIKKNGLTNPITVWIDDPEAELDSIVREDASLLDGRNRLAAMELEALPAPVEPDPLAIPSFLLRDRQAATPTEHPSSQGGLK